VRGNELFEFLPAGENDVEGNFHDRSMAIFFMSDIDY
jgi:hypothetical protein